MSPFRDQADVVWTNTYSPAEAFSRIVPAKLTELDITSTSCEYEHPNMTPEEMLAVTCVNGIQHIVYIPNRDTPSLRVDFSVPSDEYEVDLTKVGYSERK